MKAIILARPIQTGTNWQIALEANQFSVPSFISPVNVNNTDGSTVFLKYCGFIQPVSSATLKRKTKGLVMNDYQAMLEEKWIEELKKIPGESGWNCFQSLLEINNFLMRGQIVCPFLIRIWHYKNLLAWFSWWLQEIFRTPEIINLKPVYETDTIDHYPCF